MREDCQWGFLECGENRRFGCSMKYCFGGKVGILVEDCLSFWPSSRIMKVLRCHAEASKLRSSQTVYKHRGKPLRFSKSGLRQIEEFYATHYLLLK